MLSQSYSLCKILLLLAELVDISSCTLISLISITIPIIYILRAPHLMSQ